MLDPEAVRRGQFDGQFCTNFIPQAVEISEVICRASLKAWDAFTLSTVSVVLGISALVASYLPARRAASVNPLEALRANR
jgi:ABC-type lipoprotein release transport system permease subunit